MKRLLLVAAIGLLFSGSAWAEQYMGLTPGTSTRAAADKVLGRALAEEPDTGVVDYDPASHGVKRLAVRFGPNQRISEILLELPQPYSRQQMVDWLKLKQPDRLERTAEGALREFYTAQGITLTFAPGSMDQVVAMAHIASGQETSPVLPKKPQPVRAAAPSPPDNNRQLLVKKAAESYQKGKAKAEAGQLKEAVTLLEQAYQLDAEPRKHTVELAKLYRRLKRYKEAEQILNKRLQSDQASVLYYYLGRTAMDQRQAKKALINFQKSYDNRSQNDDGYFDLYWLGLAYLADKQPANAEQRLRKALSLRDKYDELYYWLGRSAEMQQHWQDAKKHYQAYLRRKPANSTLVAEAKQREGRMVQKVKESDPNYQTGRKIGEALGGALKGLLFGGNK